MRFSHGRKTLRGIATHIYAHMHTTALYITSRVMLQLYEPQMKSTNRETCFNLIEKAPGEWARFADPWSVINQIYMICRIILILYIVIKKYEHTRSSFQNSKRIKLIIRRLFSMICPRKRYKFIGAKRRKMKNRRRG